MAKFQKKTAATVPHRDGQLTRRCSVCGKAKRMFSHERMCALHAGFFPTTNAAKSALREESEKRKRASIPFRVVYLRWVSVNNFIS